MRSTDLTAPRTTRRAIVKTGTRLAYSSPLVAVSFKLSAVNVASQVSPPGACLGPDGCAHIVGVVLDAVTGQPIVGAFLDWPGFEVSTGPDGRFDSADGAGGGFPGCVRTCCGASVEAEGYVNIFSGISLTADCLLEFDGIVLGPFDGRTLDVTIKLQPLP